MKTLSQLGISPAPWKVVVENNTCGTMATVRSNHLVMHDGHIEDARLIASALDLYECLHEAVLVTCNECEDRQIDNCRGKCFVAKWRDALAKASGESEEEK